MMPFCELDLVIPRRLSRLLCLIAAVSAIVTLLISMYR